MTLSLKTIEAQPHTGAQPLVVSYGVGVDSTALLVAMQQRGIRPDAIIFSDTKAEKRETYAYIPVINAWLRRVGFPELTIVAYTPESAPYDSMEGKWLANETLPSLAYGGHSCAQVFKHGPMDKWIKAWDVAQAAWASGVKVVRAIGYDNSDRDCARRAKADRSVGNKTARETAERAIAVAKAIEAGRKPRAVGLRDDLRQFRADRAASPTGDAVRTFFDAFRDTQPLDAERSAELQAERIREWRQDDREREQDDRRALGLE